MKLNPPFRISSRLLPSVAVAGHSISIEPAGITNDGRQRFRYYIDGPDMEHSADDLRSGVGGSTIQEAMGSLLSFLGAAAESYRYKGLEGENSDLFPPTVVEWAAQHSDEISLLQLEIEENDNLITD